MGKISYTFDPEYHIDIRDLFKFLNKLYSSIPANIDDLKNRNVGGPVSATQQNKIRELEDLIKRHQDQTSKDQKLIEDLTRERDDYKELYEKTKNQASEKDIKIHELEQRQSDEQQKANQEFLQRLNTVKQEKELEIADLHKKINELRKQLSNFIPTIGDGKDSEEWFMGIQTSDKTKLERSYSDDEPFKAIVNADGEASFTFNTEKGPHKDFSQNPYKLEDFCEITEQLDNANHISPVAWGTGRVSDDGTLKVEKKAKVKLVRE